MGRINDHNYFQVNGWMLNKLGLKGNKLLVYAIIYGFSQDEETEFNGSLSYLAEFTGATTRTIINSLNELVDKEYLIKNKKTVKGVTYSSYKVKNIEQVLKKIHSEENSQVVKKFHEGSEETSSEVVKKFHGGSEEISPNNNRYKDINNNIDINSNNKGSKNTSKKNDLFKEYSKENQELLNALIEFENMRKKIRKPLTEYAKKQLLKKLDKLAFDDQTKIDILNQSSFASWTDIYELKNNKRNQKVSGNPFMEMLDEGVF